ncbi:hypothetical protein EJ08DRAFT_624338 [Tothia fuscella]|uniref:Splicing factor U2AF subunit n=1 Tax=Tothia fuscella TaxID=1048955 RepID=A0A9P4P3M0_9PEZI|nr:hypothetical protein EJ08DRAFT_624338 [Tothia fuscella]
MNGNTGPAETGRHNSSRDHYSSSRGGDRDRDTRGDRDDRRGDRDRRPDRRRSRSPGHHRTARRDYGDVDSYSSSRDHRAREREDRYAGGKGRDDRGAWDRDRGGRRDRDGGDRPPRRDRDLFEDRRGGGGQRGGRDRGDRADRGDPFARQNRAKSDSPPPKKREPTPDLTDVVSILDRQRRMTMWDIKPPGYENVTAEQAKMSGMFPLPGAPRQQAMDPTRLAAFISQPTNSAVASALKPAAARQSKRLFVHNIPVDATEDSLVDFFNLQLNGMNVISGVDPCVSALISTDHTYALLEFKSANDATVALALDGITTENNNSMQIDGGATNGDTAGLSIRRPTDYIAPTSGEDEEMQDGIVSSVVHDSPNKICVSNLPIHLNDEMVMELLGAFGTLKAFILVKDRSTEESRGFGFCEYTDPEATAIAVEGLNGMEIGDSHVKVQRASIGLQQAAGLEMSVGAMSMLAGTVSTDHEKGRVLQLMNMVTAEELMDSSEYEDIKLDIQEECEKYGKVLELKIPRPSGARTSPGVGKIFVKFDLPESAQKATSALAGRKFADRTVVVTFFSEEYFDVNAW